LKLKLVKAPIYITRGIRVEKDEVVEVKDEEVAKRMLNTGLFEVVEEKKVRKGEKKE